MCRTYRTANGAEEHGIGVLSGLQGLIGQRGAVRIDGSLGYSQTLELRPLGRGILTPPSRWSCRLKVTSRAFSTTRRTWICD